ncbi:MAG TPA: DNA polymerase subunit beta [Methanobacterium sp.]|nr:DNA polymerase subunit beta [Methanobacterium sp.]
MRARTRDFVYTIDDLYFATTSYLHPDNRIISFLRYVPDKDGERVKNNLRYSKVDTEQAYRFIRNNYNYYLFNSGSEQEMMGVPTDKIREILRPEQRLKEIMENPENELLLKVIEVADFFHDQASISYKYMGVSGSILPGLYDPEHSDIDFVIYGLKNHRNAVNTFDRLKDDPDSPLKSIGDEFWNRIYEKRIKDSTLGIEEFKWYENRKSNRGVVNGVLFDILATRDWNEIEGVYDGTTRQPLSTLKIECTIKDALAAFDNPALYKIEDTIVVEGPDLQVDELASLTHTYAGQVKEGERIVAKGKLEKLTDKKTGKSKNRLVVGTTREALDEYIKLKDLKI